MSDSYKIYASKDYVDSKLTSSGTGVTSVNGQTGVVVLNSENIGAASQSDVGVLTTRISTLEEEIAALKAILNNNDILVVNNASS